MDSCTADAEPQTVREMGVLTESCVCVPGVLGLRQPDHSAEPSGQQHRRLLAHGLPEESRGHRQSVRRHARRFRESPF
jgi:aminoglycoside N3'-acetyltransferase